MVTYGLRMYVNSFHFFNPHQSLPLSHSHTGSYDFWIVRLVAIGPNCDRSAIFATISSSGRIPRSISTRGRERTIGEYRWQEPSQEIVGPVVVINNRGGRRPMVRSIDRCILRLIVRSIVATYDRSYDNLWYQTIWNRRIQVLNMTIDLVATDLPIAITHDLCDQSYVLSTICPRLQHFSVAGRS